MAPTKITHIKDLTPDPENARKHTERNVGMLVDALQEVGAARSIVIDEAGVVLAGNATVEAAGEAGLTKVQVVDADGDTIIAVRRKGLTPEQKTRLALYDNRVAELALWDPSVLDKLQGTGSLDGLFSDAELAKALQGLQEADTDPAAEWQDMPEFVQDSAGPFRTILVHFQNQEGVDRFASLLKQPVSPQTKYLWYPPVPNASYQDKRYAARDDA